MLVIDVPVFNEDGSVQFTQKLSPEEAQGILQFALNFLVTTGLAANYAVFQRDDDEDAPEQADLFSVGTENPQ